MGYHHLSSERTIVHVSDLHFGRTDPEVVENIVQEVDRIGPNLLAVSGDLTQRARVSEFGEARASLDRMKFPRLIVPGNHDIPLFDIGRRFLAPLARYRTLIETDLRPTYEDESLFAIGLNTTRLLGVSGGSLYDDRLAGVRERLHAVSAEKLRVLVCHHPVHAGTRSRGEWVRGVERIGERVDLILSGHLHASESEILIAGGGEVRIPSLYPALLVRAGTATSTRYHGGEKNAFNVIRAHGNSVKVEVRVWNPEARRFESKTGFEFSRDGQGWCRI